MDASNLVNEKLAIHTSLGNFSNSDLSLRSSEGASAEDVKVSPEPIPNAEFLMNLRRSIVKDIT